MSNKTIGPWQVLREQSIYSNPWIEIVDHEVTHPDGSPGQYGVVRFANLAIGVLPIDEEGMTWLVGQHRFPLDAYSWELPEGGGPLLDDPLVSAKRELKEETGLTASQWAPLCEFDISNSVTDEKAMCFIASGLTQGISAPEPSEKLTLRKVSLKELFNAVLVGDIRDSLTHMMVLTAYVKARQGLLPPDVSRLITDAAQN